MEIACLILDYLRVLTWPGVVVGVVVFVLCKFSKPIIMLINRIKKFEFSGAGVSCSVEAAEAAQSQMTKTAEAAYSQITKKEITGGDDQALAEQGDSKAQYNLGAMYMKGEGVPQDNAKAVVWYRKAADQGHAEAQAQLGVMYAFSLGVPQDNAEAVVWYRKAADQGHALAQFMLGTMYADGKGVPQDDETAYIWFNLAASRSTGEDRERAVKVRDRFAALLTREQLAEAQHGAREWYNTHPQ